MTLVGTVNAEACDAVVCDGRVALRVHAGARGTTLVTLPLGAWLRATRGDRDGNGRPWPVPVVVACDAPELTIIQRLSCRPPSPPSGMGRRGWLPPARLAAYREARRLYEVEGSSRGEAAKQLGLNKNSFIGWLRKQRGVERANGAGGMTV